MVEGRDQGDVRQKGCGSTLIRCDLYCTVGDAVLACARCSCPVSFLMDFRAHGGRDRRGVAKSSLPYGFTDNRNNIEIMTIVLITAPYKLNEGVHSVETVQQIKLLRR